MTNKEALDIIDTVRELTANDMTVIYPLVSYMCRQGYLHNWKCNNETFYVDGNIII